MAEPVHSVAATITGDDAPGVLTRLLDAAASDDVEILDLEQTVVRGRLSIGLLLGVPPESVLARGGRPVEA